MNGLRQTLLGLVLLLAGSQAPAHSLGTSYSQWTLDAPSAANTAAGSQGAEVRARVSQLQLSRLQLDPRYTPDYLRQVGQLLAASLQLWAGEQRCPASRVQARQESDGWITATWRVDCPSADDWLMRTRLFETVAPSHLHFVRIDAPGRLPQQQVLNFAAPTLSLTPNGDPAPDSWRHFIQIGIEHILGGWDHLAFILMLILLAGSLRDVALVATGFTVAHSLTLAAASLGWVLVEQARVEALIGFSIVLVAAENLWLSSARDVWIPRLLLLALLAFALLGGRHLPEPFMSAGLMGELHLPPAQLVPGLLGFNIGVELGQLFVIALIWPFLLVLRRHPRAAAWSSQGVSAAAAGLGVFWFVTRLLV